uniref:Major facilitator superfamily (MFS) profile domain-containing protein n=1 Tax=Oryza glumipatula TaxID=40148 RepID=A0A0D9ZYU2_9ORYZ
MKGAEEGEDGDGERLTRDDEGLSSHLLRSMHGQASRRWGGGHRGEEVAATAAPCCRRRRLTSDEARRRSKSWEAVAACGAEAAAGRRGGGSSSLSDGKRIHSACLELPAITAAGFVDEEGLQRSGGGRVTAFVALSCATAAMGGAIYGYDISTAGGCSGGGVRRVSNYCKFDSQLLTLFTLSLYISGLLTAVLLASCGALLSVGLGFTTQSVPLYMAEMAVARYWEHSATASTLAATTVNFTVEKVRGSWGWRLSLALAGVPAVLLTVGAVFLPETPNSLVQQGKDRDKVKALLQKIRGVDTIDDELDEII